MSPDAMYSLQASTRSQNSSSLRLASAGEISTSCPFAGIAPRSCLITSLRSFCRSYSGPSCSSATRRVRWSNTSIDCGATKAASGTLVCFSVSTGSFSNRRTTS